MLATNLPDQPLPEAERLRVGVVDAEDPDALTDPVEDDAEQGLPQCLPVRALEVDRVDILVPLGRVLGVLDAPVGPPAKPLRMLLHPGMIRGALEGQVQGHLEAR